MPRNYKLDEVNKQFIITGTTEEIYKLEDFNRIIKNLNDTLEENKRNKNTIEKLIANETKVPNKEKLIRHREEHFRIQKLERLEKFEADLKQLNRNIEDVTKTLEEIEPHKKILEELK